MLVLGIGGFAVSRIAAASSLDSARGAAQLVVPQTAELLSESSTDDSYRFEFRDPDNKDDYRDVVDRRDKDQIQVRSINDERRGSEDILLNKEDVTALILETYPSATISSISLEKEDDAERYTYKALFSTDDVRGQFLVNPATGRVLERTMTFGPSVVLMDMSQSDDGTGLVPQDDAMLTLAEARVIALEAVPDGKLRKLVYSEDDASLTINVTMTRDDEQVDLVLDAVTGQVRRMDIGEDSIVTDPTGETPTQPELLGAQKVKEIVATVEEGEDIIRKQVREMEEREREEKHDYLFDMIGKRIRHYPLISKYEFDVESFIERSYLNKTTSLDKAEKEILLSLEKAESDLELLTDMEHGSEMIIEYVSSRNVTQSISEVKARHRRLEEMKEKVEEVTNTSPSKGVVNTNVQQTENVGKQSWSDERNEYVVKVYSNDDYIKLLEYMASQGIRWEKV